MFSGVKLTEHEKETLLTGKDIVVEGMISAKTGKEFSARIQVSAEKRGIEYIFENSGRFNSEYIGGVKLTKNQLEELHAGNTIFVEDMTKKNGEIFSSFVTLDANGNLCFTRYNPQTKEIYIPKEICNVRLTSEDRDILRTGKPVFLENMINSKGEEFSSFVKIDTENGRISFSRTIDGFEEKPVFKIPEEVWGVKLPATKRAELQDRKAVHVIGMTGYNGQTFDAWLKVNERLGKLDYYPVNPDIKPRQSDTPAAQQTTQKPANKEAVERDKTQKTASKQRKIA